MEPVTPGPRVLVADDDELLRTLVRAMLVNAGMRVTEAADGEIALREFQTGEEFSLILLDFEMPRLGGMEVLTAVRSGVRRTTVPIIMLTGSDSAEVESLALREGADDFIRKPITPAGLLSRVKALLARAAA